MRESTVTDMTCEQFQAVSAELALGVAGARDRADAESHLERCPACRGELRQLGELADDLAALTPPAEPPPGFESRVMAALASTRKTAPLRRRAPRRAQLVAAAAAAAVLTGAGGWIAGHASTHPPAVADAHLVTAHLVADEHPVGQVVLATGDDPWVSMAVDTDLGHQTVVCQLRDQQGQTITVGSFTLTGGYGYWAAPVPASASSITAAQLVDTAGHILATATIPNTNQ
jgi:predicted anti-sigma-YlaC factor YlaD